MKRLFVININNY